MISTGKIDLIQNDEIKEQILQFYNLDWSQFLASVAPYREYIRELIPFNIQDAIRSNCGDIPFYIANSYGYKLPESCDLQLPDELFKQTATFLRSQTDMLKKLRYQIAVNEIKIYSLDSNIKRTLKLLAEVKAYKP